MTFLAGKISNHHHPALLPQLAPLPPLPAATVTTTATTTITVITAVTFRTTGSETGTGTGGDVTETEECWERETTAVGSEQSPRASRAITTDIDVAVVVPAGAAGAAVPPLGAKGQP